MKTQNVAIFDSKIEIAPQVVPTMRDLGFDVICINPKGVYLDRGCFSANINPNECAIDAMSSDNPNHRKMYQTFVDEMLEISIPASNDKTSGGTKFFHDNGRDCHSVIKTYGILTNPEMATPSQEYRILADVKKARAILEKAAVYNKGDDSDPIVNDMRGIASSILEIIRETPKYFGQFLKVAVDGFSCFKESGFLSEMGEFAVTKISDLRTRDKTVLINMTPLELLKPFTVFNSLVAYNILVAVKMYPDGCRLHAIFEELNSLRLPNLNSELNTARGQNFTCEMYTQSEVGTENAYSKEVAEEIAVNCDISHYMACNTLKEAEHTSKLIGNHTIRTASANVSEDSFEKIGQSFQDKEVPRLSPQDVMSLPPDDQIISVRGMKPIYARKIRQWEISGLTLADNPLEGAAPKVPAKMGLKITKDGVKLKFPRRKRANPFLPIWWRIRHYFNPTYYIWLAVWVAILAAVQFWQPTPDLPALRITYQNNGDGSGRCDYITILGQRHTIYTSYCPIVTFGNWEI